MSIVQSIKYIWNESDFFLNRIILIFILLFIFSSIFSIAISQITYFTAIFFCILKWIKEKKIELKSTGLEIYFGLFIVSEIISAIFSLNTLESIYYFHKRIVIIPIIYLLYFWLKERIRIEVALNIWFFSMLIVALYGMMDILLNLNSYLHFERRLNLFQFYMTAGGLMMISTLFLLSVITHPLTPKSFKVFSFLTFIFSSICLLFTFTRGSWLGFIFGSALISFQRSKLIFLFISITVFILVLIVPTEFKDRIFSIFDPNHPNNIERIQMWSTGWRIFQDHPFFGIGDIGTEEVYKIYGPEGSNPVGHLHNNFITIMVKLGVFGLIVTLILFVKVFIMEYKIILFSKADWLVNSIALGAAASFLGFQINGLFEWNFGDTEVVMFLYLTIGLALSAGKLIKEKVS